jgi:hypothetical protein
MRAKNKIFHLDCFRCAACEKQLVPGEEFALKYDGIFCKDDSKGAIATAANDTQSHEFSLIEREENNNKELEEDDLDSRYGSKSVEDDEDSFKIEEGFVETALDELGE